MMSEQQAKQIADEARRVIANGGTYVHTAADGHEVKIFYVAGGSFCRVDARTPDREMVAGLSTTEQWTGAALRFFEAAVREIGTRAVAA